MKHARVYKRAAGLICLPYSQTTVGVWMAVHPYVVIDSNSSQEVIGQSVIKVLRDSNKTKIPHPSDWKTVKSPTLEAAGAKSWREFMKGTVSCGIDGDGKILTFTPDKPDENTRSRGGSIPQHELAVTIPAKSSSREIGAAVLEALKKSS